MRNKAELSYALPIGTSLQNGKYKILKVIGAGGMGITYLATKKADTTFEDDEQLVIKELFITPNNTNYHCTRSHKNNHTVIPEGKLKENFVQYKERFYSEAQTLHKFRYLEAMVKVKDLFEENDTVYFTMEYIDGKNLQEFVLQKGKLHIEETLTYLEKIGKLLSNIHKEDFLHRDVKPENILIDKKDNSYLIDFGIAKGYDKMGIVKTITAMGTKRYAPPEQLAGEKNMISAAIDVFALSNTFYFCLTGKAPQTTDEASYQGEKTVKDFVPNIASSINTTIEKARKRNAKFRTQNIDVFLKAIIKFSNNESNKKLTKAHKRNKKTPTNIVDEKTIIEQPKKPTNFTQKVKNTNLEMIAVAGGSFNMGSDDYEDEQPIHKVNLDSFYIAKYPVTQQLWKAVMGNNPSWFKKGLELKSGGIFSSAITLNKNTMQHPVETVSWNDTQKFIKKLNQITGKSYSLPTEAQWEFAAKGGNITKAYKYAGSNNINEVAWYDKNSYDLGKKHPHYGTNPVGQKQANELGIYDMSGNVWEWCNDWYGAEYYKKSPAKNPKGPSSGDYRVLRGGSWNDGAQYCRSAYRNFNGPGNSYSGMGFRLVLSPQ